MPRSSSTAGLVIARNLYLLHLFIKTGIFDQIGEHFDVDQGLYIFLFRLLLMVTELGHLSLECPRRGIRISTINIHN